MTIALCSGAFIAICFLLAVAFGCAKTASRGVRHYRGFALQELPDGRTLVLLSEREVGWFPTGQDARERLDAIIEMRASPMYVCGYPVGLLCNHE